MDEKFVFNDGTVIYSEICKNIVGISNIDVIGESRFHYSIFNTEYKCLNSFYHTDQKQLEKERQGFIEWVDYWKKEKKNEIT